MSLYVYSEKDVIPSNKKLVVNNRAFFGVNSIIPDTALVKDILLGVDEASRVSDTLFNGRNSDVVGEVHKDCLSAGVMTLLNILQHPDTIFSLASCGYNALQFLPRIQEGYVYWDLPVTLYTGDGTCDIIYDGKHFTNFYEFMDYGRDREESHD